jgi:hypothetical protein
MRTAPAMYASENLRSRMELPQVGETRYFERDGDAEYDEWMDEQANEGGEQHD